MANPEDAVGNMWQIHCFISVRPQDEILDKSILDKPILDKQ